MTKVKQKQSKRRIEILEAVIPLISQQSFEEISVAEICQSIGISIGSFYHYFTTKNDLLIGLLWIIDEDLVENTFPLLTNKNELENLKLFAHGWAEHVSSHGIERSKLISSINPDNEALAERDRPAIRKLLEIITSGQAKKQITTEYDADTLTDLFLITMRGITQDWSRRDGSYALTERMDQSIEILLRAFLPAHVRAKAKGAPERKKTAKQ
ncbi:MAG: TetR/AcrR family transcriptional regulator [Lachnospiraceae bacterium]|nr:TetR/AcrR family transcriptional regulator [Lachnospiraceae bacterium]